jgi:hypothetical glycosyl hydrolase
MGDMKLAYHLYKRSSWIDLGPNMKSSNDGIHAASLGGIWNSAVLGFGGLSQKEESLVVEPKLPEEWNRLSFYYIFKGSRLWFEITKDRITIKNHDKTGIPVSIYGKESVLENELEAAY